MKALLVVANATELLTVWKMHGVIEFAIAILTSE